MKSLLARGGVEFIAVLLGIDPALASGAFVTTVTDVVGFSLRMNQ